jgi:hypothetical protein
LWVALYMGLDTKWARPQVRRRWAWKTPKLSIEAHGLLVFSPAVRGWWGLVSVQRAHGLTPHASASASLHQPSGVQDEDGGGQGSLSVCLPARHARPRKIAYPGDACAQATRRLLRQANPLLHSTCILWTFWVYCWCHATAAPTHSFFTFLLCKRNSRYSDSLGGGG